MPPKVHRDLLDQTIAGLRPTDTDWVCSQFAKQRAGFNDHGHRMFGVMLKRLDAMQNALCGGAELTAEQRATATAAMKYFFAQADYIEDEYHEVGYVDDALVIEEAMKRLEGAIQDPA
ncbi:MAG: hypothetical protein RLY93_20085 [Sumerlaeia bacterium]